MAPAPPWMTMPHCGLRGGGGSMASRASSFAAACGEAQPDSATKAERAARSVRRRTEHPESMRELYLASCFRVDARGGRIHCTAARVERPCEDWRRPVSVIRPATPADLSALGTAL